MLIPKGQIYRLSNAISDDWLNLLKKGVVYTIL